MKNEKVYEETVSTLSDAFNKGHLVSGDTRTCAMGTMFKAIGKKLGIPHQAWSKKFLTRGEIQDDGTIENFQQIIAKDDEIIMEVGSLLAMMPESVPLEELRKAFKNGKCDADPDEWNGYANKLIAASPYTPEELHKIEYTFETGCGNKENKTRDDIHNGLLAVIHLLDEIHENDDKSLTHASKARFIKEEAHV